MSDPAACVAWRIGASTAAPLAQAARDALAELRLPFGMPGLALLDATACRFLPLNGYDQRIVFDPASGGYRQAQAWQHNVAERYIQFADLVRRQGLGGVFALNFFDAQSWDYGRVLGAALPLPVFQFSRLRGQRQVILAPADRYYMGPDGDNCPAANTDTLRFAEKQPRAVWRGQLTGVHRSGRELFWCAAIKREIFDARLALTPFLLDVMFHRFGRYDFVRRYRDSLACDVGLVHEPDRDADSALAESDPGFAPWRTLFRPPLDRAAQLQFRFIVCLEGNDYASSLFWALNSNSVVLMPPPRWQTILHFGLHPWEHYIPLAEDCSDLEARIAWGNAHPEECGAIGARACAFMRACNDAGLRTALDVAVIRRYLEMTA